MNTILQVRFVNFGDDVAAKVVFVQPNFNLKDCPLRAIRYASPVVGERYYFPSIDAAQERFNEWIDTLNSSDAPIPRIERGDDTNEQRYRVHTFNKYVHFIIGEESLQALNKIYGKEAPIYEKKKIAANWAKIVPREIKPYEMCFDKTVACDDCVRRCEVINQLQQTEANGLEIWDLTVTSN